jgi:hypothetical protein
VNHFDRDLQRRLARHEHDAAPTALAHLRQIGARDANAAQDIDFEHLAPFVVGEVNEAFARIHGAEVVDEDVDGGDRPFHFFGAFRGREIPRRGRNRGARKRGRDVGDGAIDALRSAAVHPDMRAGLRQSCRDREADAGGRPRDQGGLSRKIEIHAQFRGGEGIKAQQASMLRAKRQARLHR